MCIAQKHYTCCAAVYPSPCNPPRTPCARRQEATQPPDFFFNGLPGSSPFGHRCRCYCYPGSRVV